MSESKQFLNIIRIFDPDQQTELIEIMKQYNFDEIIERRGTNCVKYDLLKKDFGNENLVPLWVADMDFRTPDFIVNAIKKRLEHEIFGYTFDSDSYYNSIIEWVHYKHNWKIQREWLSYIPGIVKGIGFVLQCFTKPGDKVIIQPPVYGAVFYRTGGHPLAAAAAAQLPCHQYGLRHQFPQKPVRGLHSDRAAAAAGHRLGRQSVRRSDEHSARSHGAAGSFSLPSGTAADRQCAHCRAGAEQRGRCSAGRDAVAQKHPWHCRIAQHRGRICALVSRAADTSAFSVLLRLACRDRRAGVLP